MERELTPPEYGDCCEDCGRHIAKGKLCRTCSIDHGKLEHSEDE